MTAVGGAPAQDSRKETFDDDSPRPNHFPGVWAGNVVDPRAQVITAAGAGSAAAIALNADLVDEDVRNAVRDLDHGLLPRPTVGANPKESS